MSDTVIYKYPLEVATRQSIKVPYGEVLCVQMQDGIPCMWVQVLVNNYASEREIHTYGTGDLIPSDCGMYLGTYQYSGLVLHLFSKDFPCE